MTDDALHEVTASLLGAAIARAGFVFVEGTALQSLLEAHGPLKGWDGFATSWNDLKLDNYMADGGRYRRRRHALFAIDEQGQLLQRPHGPHYQSTDYNPLNGGIERWYEPVIADVAESPILRAILLGCDEIFSAASNLQAGWRIEVHQFRIEARQGEPGLPTPEGVHRDGVDYVLAMMVCRHNIASGTTTVHDVVGKTLGNFTLAQPFDAALLDDNRVWHGVTPVRPLDASTGAYRDVLVVTFSRSMASAGARGEQS
jgi:hypothetical protein